MQYDDKLITLDNLGTFKGKMEGEIDKASHDLIADEYDATKTYNVGDVVLHDGFLYECNTAIGTAEEWDPTHWTQVKVTELNGEDEFEVYTGTVNTYVTLTAEQIKKAKEGKFVIRYQDHLLVASSGYTSSSSGDYIILFEAYYLKSENDVNVPKILAYTRAYVQLNCTTGKFLDVIRLGYSLAAVNHVSDNFVGATTVPSSNDTRIIRSLNLRKTQDMIAPVYDSSLTYAVGDVVIYQNDLYQCNMAIDTAEAWDATHWTQVKVTELGGEGVKYVEVVNADFTSMTDEHADEVENADVLVYNGNCYRKYSTQSTIIQFVNFTLDNNGELWKNIIQYDTTSSPKRIGGNYCHITIASVYKIANDFSSTQSYVVGDLVWRDYTLYRCIVAHSGAWVADDFQQVNVSQAIQASALTNGKMVKTIPNNNTFSAQDLEDIKNELVVAIEDSNRLFYIRCPQVDREGYKAYSKHILVSIGYMEVGYIETIEDVDISTGAVNRRYGAVYASASKPLTTSNINSGTPTEVIGFDSNNKLVRGAAPGGEDDIAIHNSLNALTQDEIKLAKKGKLYIDYGDENYYVPTAISDSSIRFSTYHFSSMGERGGVYHPILVQESYMTVTISTGVIRGPYQNNQWAVEAVDTNFFASNVDPVADGKRIVREMNVVGKLIPTYSSSDAGKVVKINSSGTGVELDDIDVETATELEVNRLFRTEYAITATVTNGSASGDESIWTKETAEVTIVPSSGYVLPETITVSGATYSYDNSTGVVSLSAATGAVTVTATCPPTPAEMPEKGDVITLDGGTARYRVLKTDGNVAEVLALDDVANSMFNNSSVTTTFSDGSTGLKYENSTLDTYMNSMFYNSLSAGIKNAIVQKAITQSIYQYGYSTMSEYDFTIKRINSGTDRYKRKGQVSVGNRYCYSLDIDDVAEYLGAGSGNTVLGSDLNNMFFEQTTTASKTIWLDSSYSGNSEVAFVVSGVGFFGNYGYYNSLVVRPAFQVDLSKVSWSKE